MTVRPVAVACPRRVRDWLAAVPPGPCRVLHRGAHAAYVELAGPSGRRCVGVVGTAAPALPCALRLASPDLGGLTTGSAYVSGGMLHLDGVGLQIGRLGDVSLPRRHLDQRVGVAGLSERMGRTLVERLGEGPGLTPEADDVLVGWLAVHRAAGWSTPRLDAGVRAASDRTTLLSATLLECALAGEVLPELGRWIEAAGTPAEDAAAASLRRIGHTSGEAVRRGARLALDAMHRTTDSAA